MRSFGNRDDTFVCDEPLYAHYLKVTGKNHPVAAEIIAHHESDWQKVIAWLTGEVPQGKAIFYQKQMAHHLLPEIERGWLNDLANCFLIRDPQEMITSLIKIIPQPSLEDTGLPQQWEIFKLVREQTGKIPPVLDSQDIQNHPRNLLGKLCDCLGIAFQESMLTWPAGLRPTDGIWGKHWYSQVETSTGFRPYQPKDDEVPDCLKSLCEECQSIYDRLAKHKLR